MDPGHRQNGGQQQERHLDASGGHFSKEQAPSWLGAGVWRLEGGYGCRWVLSGVSRGSERRVFASVEPVQAPHLGASGGHLRGEGGT